jgi:hypothetical protein
MNARYGRATTPQRVSLLRACETALCFFHDVDRDGN